MEPISRIDSLTNQLFFRGYKITDYCKGTNFETALYLLINSQWPSNSEVETITNRMVELRNYYNDDMKSLFDLAWSLEKIRIDNNLDLYDALLTFVTLAPIVVANELNMNRGGFTKNPHNSLGHAANFLWMTKGVIPNEIDLNDFQTALILHMDDPENPSLSRLLETLNENQNISEAIISALIAHTGPLHHGAGTEAMVMLREMREQSNARGYLKRKLKSGGKIYGLGHRIYRGIDPRAVVLREMLEKRTMKTNDVWLLKITDTVAKEGRILLSKQKRIDVYPNVDLYNAAIYYTFGYPPELNTSLFAVSRAAGWMAHTLEYFRSR
jgi:citrate synthase